MAQTTAKSVQEAVTIWQKGARNDFQIAMNKPPAAKAESMFNRLSPTLTSEFITENFPGILGVGELTDFRGSVDYSGLDNYDVSIDSEERAKGLRFTFRSMQADKKNLRRLQNSPQILAGLTRKVKFKLLVDLLEANPIWDASGKATFADDHFFGDNNITVSGLSSATNPTEGDINTILEAIWTQLATFTNDHGDVLEEISDTSQLIIIAHSQYNTGLRRVARQQFIPRASAAIDNINADTYDHWTSPRFNVANTVWFIARVEAQDDAGNELGQTSPFVRTVFTDYELLIGGEGGRDNDEVFRNKRQVEVNTYGEEGFGVIDATRLLKVTLST